MTELLPAKTRSLPFSPTQIKSIDNDGTWDVGDPNIRSNPPVRPNLPLVSIPAGTTLYHGTDSKKSFTTLDGPAWLTSDIQKAEEWAGWAEEGGGGKKRVLTFSTKKMLQLLDTRSLQRWKRVGMALMNDDEPYMWTLARKVAEAGFDGWFGDTEVMVSRPREALAYRGVTAVGENPAKSRHVAHPQPSFFFGRSGAGILFHCVSDDTYLLLLRSEHVNEPGTLGIPGGACKNDDKGEGIYLPGDAVAINRRGSWNCAKRETLEELQWFPEGRLNNDRSVAFKTSDFQYTTFVVDLTAEQKEDAIRRIELNWENEEYIWMTLPEMIAAKEQLHFGVQHVLERIHA